METPEPKTYALTTETLLTMLDDAIAFLSPDSEQCYCVHCLVHCLDTVAESLATIKTAILERF